MRHAQTLAEGIHNRALVKSTGLGIALSAKDAHRPTGPTKPLWRKREIVRQERIVEYTTVDETGVMQVCGGVHLLSYSQVYRIFVCVCVCM